MAIDVAAQVRYWQDGSSDDLEAARALLDARKLRQAGFFVHLAIEKAVKACVVATTQDVAPRTHDLLSLIHRTHIQLNEQQREFMGRVQVYCLEGRYPTELPPLPSAEIVAQDLELATEMVQWLTNQSNRP